MTLKLESTFAGTAIAAFIALHSPDKIFTKSADAGGFLVDGTTSAENLNDLARLIHDLPIWGMKNNGYRAPPAQRQ